MHKKRSRYGLRVIATTMAQWLGKTAPCDPIAQHVEATTATAGGKPWKRKKAKRRG
jgi:hypothetical protein